MEHNRTGFTPHIVLAGAVAWCAAILAAPLFPIPSLYPLFGMICHQEPARSWHVFGEPLAVCIRCASIYFGFLIGLLTRFPANPSFLRGALIAALLEFVVEQLFIDLPLARTLTGVCFGLAVAGFVERGVTELFHRRRSCDPV